MKNVDWKDVLIRALKTFFQTAGSVFVAALSGVNFADKKSDMFWIGLAMSAGAAGLSAVWNGVLSPLFDNVTDNGLNGEPIDPDKVKEE